MNVIEQNYLKGHFLMAIPGLMDPNFHQTVTLICEHTHEGAMGIIIDRRVSELGSDQIFQELDIAFLPEQGNIPLHFGGPVHGGEVFILHGPPFHWEGCLVVSPEFGLSNTSDILEAIAMGRGPHDFLIAIGCSGWGAGQLEAEMKENTWLTGLASTDIVFNTPLERRWFAAIQNLGIDPDLLSGEAGHA